MFCDRYFKEINMAARKTNSRKKSSKAAGSKKSTGTRSRKKNTVQRASASSKRQAKKPVDIGRRQVQDIVLMLTKLFLELHL